MSPNRPWLCSPAAPALLVLFGLVFGFAVFHLAGLQWSPMTTRLYYGGLFLWGGAILVQRRTLLRRHGLIDWLCVGFLLWLLVSLAQHYAGSLAAPYYAKFLPFLVLLPYCLGRLMAREDFDILFKALPWMGGLLLLLCVLDFWWAPSDEVVDSRWRFFGINHSPLLIAMLVSVALLALTQQLLTATTLRWRSQSIASWLAFGVFSGALVLIAARGALIACAIALVCMMVLAHAAWRRKLSVLGYFVVVIAVAFFMLPKPQSEFYARVRASADEGIFLNPNIPEHAAIIAKLKANPDPRCRPLLEGVNSVLIRRVLYLEAIDLTQKHPLAGVGATRFGDYSCGGPGAYPHSTVLQAFAELGIFGGGALLALFATSLATAALVYRRARAYSDEALFWTTLIVFFALIDQIYGNYFMAAGSFFLFGAIHHLRVRANVTNA